MHDVAEVIRARSVAESKTADLEAPWELSFTCLGVGPWQGGRATIPQNL
jgi:hypothetical protein